MIVPALDSIENCTADKIAQDPARATLAPKLKKADGCVRWNQSSADVCNFIRAMIPWPGAFTFHVSRASGERRRLILLEAKPGPERRRRRRKKLSGSVPGKVVIADKQLAIATADGLVSLLRVIPEGGRPMSGNAYLRGHAVVVGDWLRGPE